MSVKQDLENIVADTRWTQLFEERLKRSYNYHNLAFWIALRDLKAYLETEENPAESDLSARMDSILSTYFDTESSSSVALSFRAKERFKRSRTQSVDEMKKAIELSSREVETLLVAEVKAFLADAPPPSQTKSPRAQSVAAPNFVSPRPAADPKAPAPATGSRTLRVQSEVVASPTGSYDLRAATPANSVQPPVKKALPPPTKAPSLSLAPPPAVSSGTASEPLSPGGSRGQTTKPSPPATVAASKPSGTVPSVSSVPPSNRSLRVYPWDVSPNEEEYPRRYSEKMALFVWGENGVDQLGVPGGAPGAERTSPLQVSGAAAENMVYVACSETYSIAVDSNGQAYCCGKAIDSSVFVPFLEGHIVRQIGCGLQFCIALLDNGKLLYFGFANHAMERLPLAESVIKILCGNRHCVALTSQGHVFTWGSDEKKQLGHGGPDRVPKPMHLAALEDVLDVAAGQNSSACVTASGAVYAWGAVVASVRPEIVHLEEMRSRNVFRVACSDKYVVGLSDLGRVFVWHPDAVTELSLPSLPNPSICLRSASVFYVQCYDAILYALTDAGDVITWGDYSAALGQGSRVNAKKYSESPMRLPKFQVTSARHLAASEKHVVIATGDGTSLRESLIWELFSHERDYGRTLYAVVDEYSRRIKIKDTPHLFRNAKLLQDNHMGLVREFMRLLERAPRVSAAEVGAIYATCFANSELVELYRSWTQETAVPLEKLSRPKLAAQLAEIELEVEAVVKKTDTQQQAAHSFSLVSLLREPPKYLQWLHEQLTMVLEATPEDHLDRSPLQQALMAILNANGGPFPPCERKSSLPPSLPPTDRTDASTRRGLSDSVSGSLVSKQKVAPPLEKKASISNNVGGDAVEELMQERMRFRALQMELDIFRDANAELVRYAKALEGELLSNSSATRFGSLQGIQQWEEELVGLAAENAELRARVRLLDVYRTNLANLTGVKDLPAGSGGISLDDSFTTTSDEIAVPSSGKQSTPVALSKAKSQNILGSESPVSRSPVVNAKRAHDSGTLRPSMSANGLASSGVIPSVGGETEEALRKRINPAAGRLLSEGEGGAARSLEQFTFDDANKTGVQYAGSDLKAASLEKLLEHLMQSSGSLALNTFLISYRNFASPQDVLRRLVYMYCMAPKDKAKVIWVRVLNFFKNWCVSFYEEDWQNDERLRNDLNSFLDDIVVPSFPTSAGLAVNAIRDRFRAGDASSAQATRAPMKPSGPLVLANYKAQVVAEQLIISEHECFRSIKPGECFNQNWVKKNKGELSPNIVNLTNRFNKLSRWVAYEICQHSDVKERKAALEKFIAVALLCKEQYRAFGIVMMIMGGLTSSPVYRLRKTWDALSRAQQNSFNELKDFTKSEKNFENLREATRTADLPCLPYIGTYLGDLTFIDTGSSDYSGEGLINWSKFQATANTLLRLQALQKTPYSFDGGYVTEWHQFLYHLPYDRNEQELYELSKRVEPNVPTHTK